VRWSPFDGGHEIALRARVGLRRPVVEVVEARGLASSAPKMNPGGL
jgi:hypothetical protein